MSIPFPKLHIAASAINRILNAVEGEKSLALGQPEQLYPPTISDPTSKGASIDAKANAPLQPADVPPQAASTVDQQAATTSALGGSPFDGALIGLAGSAG